MFDHGVFIYGESDDGTREIIRELAPDWEVVSARDERFDTRVLDQQVMEAEERFEGWKIAINVSEFLGCPDLRRYVSGRGVAGMRTRGVVMVDPPELWDVPLDSSRPLVLQRHHGYFENERGMDDPFRTRTLERSRLLHQCPHGNYGVGRHDDTVGAGVHYDLPLLWFGFSPMTPEGRRRKTQQNAWLSERDRAQYGMASTHKACATEEALRSVWEWEWSRSVNLLEDPGYQTIYANMLEAWG